MSAFGGKTDIAQELIAIEFRGHGLGPA